MMTKAQLAIALNQINNLAQLAMVNSMSSPPNNTIKWPIILNVKATMLQSDTQISPVTIKMSEYNTKKTDEVEWYSDPFYTHKGYKMFVLMLLVMVMVKVLTCQCSCDS